MKQKVLVFFLLALASGIVYGQNSIPDNLASLFHHQLISFPQEKIYLHTDKPYYLSGEKIWFRAYLADAVTHIPSPFSRYIYVELINPLDSVVARVKIRPDEVEAYHGHLPIPDDVPEDDYTLRAYTTYMQSIDEDYWYAKTVHIGQGGGAIHRAPNPDSDFDVTFYPEGGSLMLGTVCRLVFKAMKADGQSSDITGVVYDHTHTPITEFKSDHLGMGSFVLLAEKGKSYYAVCQNENGQSACFDLPMSTDNGYALSVGQMRDNIYVSVLKPAEALLDEELYLLAHTRGMVYWVDRWDQEKNQTVIPNDLFPSGVLSLLLFNAQYQPVSERLVFVNHFDYAMVDYQSDKTQFAPRSLVKKNITLTDQEGQPLRGNFSVSVTSDSTIIPDSTANILTQMLLTSDLKGYIENPAYYFQNTTKSTAALDLLMCTQGWRRYNITELAKGRLAEPAFPIEMGMEISGRVQSVLNGRAVAGIEVTATSLTGGSHSTGQTDREGRFYLSVGELPNNAHYVVGVDAKKGMTRMDLILDVETFPHKTLPNTPSVEIDKTKFTQYVQKTEWQHAYEDTIQTTQLSAAVVTVQRKTPQKSQLYTEPDATMTEEQIKKVFAKSVYDLIALLPGVQVFPPSVNAPGNNDPLGVRKPPPTIVMRSARTLSSPSPPLILVDNIPFDIDYLEQINVYDIEQIDIISGTSAAVFGSRAWGGAIAIFTKSGHSPVSKNVQPFHIKTFTLLGYQLPIEFYAPKYETQAQRNNPKPDLRTTIHWQPVVQTDDRGVASFEFYTADKNTSYTVVIEGLSDDGTIIYHQAKLWH